MGIGIKNLIKILRDFFGGGADISAANPLPVTDVPASPPHSALCSDTTIPAGTTYHVSSGDVWGVLALAIEAGAELRIDGEVHAWEDVTGTGIITGEGDLRLH